MADKKSKSGIGLLGISGFSIFLGIMGYLIYGTVKGALAVFALSYVLSVADIIMFIPIAGPFIFWALTRNRIIPFFLELGEINHTWLISVAFWVPFVVGLLISAVVTVVVIIWLIGVLLAKDWKWYKFKRKKKEKEEKDPFETFF